jgi:hypothetical protein
MIKKEILPMSKTQSNNSILVNQSFESLRKNIQKNGQKIFDQILRNYYYRKRPKNIIHRCIFCSSIATTKEHIIPGWLHRQFSDATFTSQINGQVFDFKRTTVPACTTCNSEILGRIERYLVLRLNEIGIVDSPFSYHDMDIIIRWLELIDYKFQIMNIIQRFIVLKGTSYDPKYAQIPLGVLRRDLDPSQMLKQLEQSIKRLGVKNKKSRYHAFLQYQRLMDDSEQVFLHGMGNFIALEIPRHYVGIFYFFRKSFTTHSAVHSAMENVIKSAIPVKIDKYPKAEKLRT